MLTTTGDNLLSLPQMDHEHLELIAEENEFSFAVGAEASRVERGHNADRLSCGSYFAERKTTL
jgi:hypothetical protein